MILASCILTLFALLLLLPFLPGLRELYKHKRARPLPIAMGPTAESSNHSSSLSRGAHFKRLSGRPLSTYTATHPDPEKRPFSLSDESWYFGRNEVIIPPHASVSETLVSERPLRIRRGAHLKKSVKCHQEVVIEEGVIIDGDLFSDKKITIGAKSHLHGNLFSQREVHLADGVTIGAPGKEISVIGIGGVFLAGNVTIYGSVKTEGKGVIV